MYYIDIDWNEIIIYQDQEKFHKESSMILRDLKTNELLFIGGNSQIHLKDSKNFLAIVPIENKKILSYDDLNLLLDYILKKLNLENVTFVDRYNLEKHKIKVKVNFINEIDFIKIMSKKNKYLELRNNEMQIFDLNKISIEIIKIGFYKILNYLNRFFYLNYNGLLNTLKAIELFENLKNKTLSTVDLKEIDSGENIKVENYNKELLLSEVTKLFNQILEDKNLLEFDFNENFQKLKQLYD